MALTANQELKINEIIAWYTNLLQNNKELSITDVITEIKLSISAIQNGVGTPFNTVVSAMTSPLANGEFFTVTVEVGKRGIYQYDSNSENGYVLIEPFREVDNEPIENSNNFLTSGTINEIIKGIETAIVVRDVDYQKNQFKTILADYENLEIGNFTHSATNGEMESIILASFIKKPKIQNNTSTAKYKVVHFKYTVATQLLELVIAKSTDAGVTYPAYIYAYITAVDGILKGSGNQGVERFQFELDTKYLEEYCVNNALTVFNYYVLPYPSEGNLIFKNDELDTSQKKNLELETLTFGNNSNAQIFHKKNNENFSFSFDIKSFTTPDNLFFLELNDGSSRLRIYQETDGGGASEITFSERPKILTIKDEENGNKVYIPLAVKTHSNLFIPTKVKFNVINSEIHLLVDNAYVCNLSLNFPDFNYKNSTKTDILKLIPFSSYRGDLIFENIKSDFVEQIDFSKFSKDISLEMKKNDIAIIEKMGGEVLRGTLDGNQAAVKIPIPFSHLGGTIEFDIQPNIDINTAPVGSDTHNLFELFIPNSDRGRFKMFIEQKKNENGDARLKFYDAYFKTLMKFDSSSNIRGLASNDKIKNYWNGSWAFGVKVKCNASVTYNNGNSTDANMQVASGMEDTTLHMEYNLNTQTGVFRIFHSTNDVTIYSYNFDETTTIETLYNNLANATFNGTGDVLKLEVKDENVVGETLVKDLAMLDNVSMVRSQTYYIADGLIEEFKVDSGATINDSYFTYIPFNSSTVKHEVKIIYKFLGKDGVTEIEDVSSVDKLIDGTFTTGSFKIIVDGSIVAEIPFQEAVNSGSIAYNKAKLKENVQAWLYLGCDSYSTNDFKGKISNFKHTHSTKINVPIILGTYGHAGIDSTNENGQVNWGNTSGGTYEFNIQRLAFAFNDLKERGFVNINAKQLNNYLFNGGNLPKKCFIHMVDDARWEHFRNEKFRKIYRKYNVSCVISAHYDDRLDRVVVGASTDEFPNIEEIHAAIRSNEIDVVIHGYQHPRHGNMSYQQMKNYLPKITEGMRKMGIYTNTNLITHGDWHPHTINAFKEIGITTFFESGNINLPKSLISKNVTKPESRLSIDAITINDFKDYLKKLEDNFK